MSKYDDMSFGKAFAKARDELGSGKTFKWKGKTYTTNYKNEKGTAPKKTSTRPAARGEERKPSSSSAPDKPTKRPKSRPEGLGGRKSNPKGTRAPETSTRPRGRDDAPKNQGGGRGDGLREMARRAIDRPSSSSEPTLDGVSLSDFKAMTGPERIKKGLPLTLMGFKRDAKKGSNSTPTSRGNRGARNAPGSAMNKGGMVKSGKKDYKNSGMFYKSGSPRGYK